MAERFKGQVALVTGGNSGIGRAAAVAFAAEGARVVVAARREAESEETVRLIRDAGGEAIAVRTDVAVASDVEAMVEQTVRTYGRLDCAFNNAGTGEGGRPDPRSRGGRVGPGRGHKPEGRMVVHEVPGPADARSGRRSDR